MIKFVVFVASLAVICQAAPGGYLAKGGVYKELGANKDYIGAAAEAGIVTKLKKILNFFEKFKQTTLTH